MSYLDADYRAVLDRPAPMRDKLIHSYSELNNPFAVLLYHGRPTVNGTAGRKTQLGLRMVQLAEDDPDTTIEARPANDRDAIRSRSTSALQENKWQE